MRPVSEATSRISGKCFERKYIALGRIVTRWKDIVGEDMAHKAQPVKLHYRKYEKGGKPDTRLDIAATEADATRMRLQVGLILERINQVFGEDWITSIRFVSVPSNTEPPKARPDKRPLSGSDRNYLSGMLENVADGDIRERLNNLGQEILRETP